MAKSDLRRLYGAVRDVPDFPAPGIIFRDITPLLVDPVLFRQAVRFMRAPLRQLRIDKVLAIESRGFILGAPIALQLKAGLVPARKEGKLPRTTHRIEYVLEYGADAIEIHADAIARGDHVLVVDDLLATGGTASAAVQAVRQAGGIVVGVSLLIELLELEGRRKLMDVPLWSVLTYPERQGA